MKHPPRNNAIETDVRAISAIHTQPHGWIRLGETYQPIRRNVEIIRVIREPGEMSYVVWYELWIDGSPMERVNGRYVTLVRYGEPLPDIDEVPF